MATAIGFQFSTAKVIKEDQYPTIIDSDHCFHPNKKLFGMIVGLGCGLVTAIIFHFILLNPLLNAKKEFKLSLSFITQRFKKDDEKQIDEIPEYGEISKNLEISDATAKIGTNVNGHTNNGYANNYSSSTKGDLEKQEPNIKDQEFEMDNSLVPNEHEEVKKVFRPLQVVAAAFAALNHGGNDVGNCIGPLVVIWYVYKNPLDFSNHDDGDATFWLFWGGIGISLGLLIFGRRVIMTMGTKITPMTPSLGFVSVMSSTTIVMLCTLLGIPVSTTQCQVMALVGGGIARGWIDHG